MNDKLIVGARPLQQGQYTQTDHSKSRIVVSACGGPIAVQNHHGELLGCGLDYPSGSYIRPDSTGLYTARHPNARPGFAVALDFMDIVGRHKHKNKTGVFKYIHSSREAPFEFTLRLNDTLCSVHSQSQRVLPPEDFISGVRFYGYVFNHGVVKALKAEASSEFISEYNYKMVINQDKLLSIMSAITHKIDYELYMEIVFNNKLSQYEGYKQYNYDSSWIIPVLLVENTVSYHDHGRNVRHRQEGYKIIRHPKYGEVPDFESRELYFEHIYRTS